MRAFRDMGREDQILALLIEGEPGEAFPASLCEIRRSIVEADGATREQIAEVEPLAADVRPVDGRTASEAKHSAQLKLLSTVLGCRYDDLRRRDQERRMRWLIRTVGVLSGPLVFAASMTAIALTAKEEERKARIESDTNFKKAQQTVNDFLTAVSESEELKLLPNTQAFRRTLLEKARDYYQDFLKFRPRDGRVTFETAEASHRLAHVIAEIGSRQDSLKAHLDALPLYETLAAAANASGQAIDGLARNLLCLGIIQGSVEQTSEAEASYHCAGQLFETLARDNPKVARYQDALAGALNSLGLLQSDTNHRAEAERAYARAVEALESLVHDNPKVDRYQDGLAAALNSLGNLQSDTNRRAEAERTYARALAIREGLVRDNPKVVGYQNGLANALTNLGNLQRIIGHLSEAERSHRKSLAIREVLVSENLENPEFRSGTGLTLNNLAAALDDASRHEEAVDLYRRAIVFQRKARASNPRNPTYRQFLSDHYLGLSKALRALHRPSEAAEETRERAKLWPGGAGELYNIACELDLCVPPATGTEATRLGDEVMEALRAAVAAGWSDAAHTARDPDLVPLRGQTDFQRLLQALQDRVFPADLFALGK